MNIAAYCRVSTDTKDQLNSLAAQKEFFQSFADKNGHNLVKMYADEGITGTRLKKREEFKKLMHDAHHGIFDMIVVKDISRFARNAVDFLQSIRTLKSMGITCSFVNANLSTSDGEMILGTLALVAQEESSNTSKRVKYTKRQNAEKGRVPNLVYGYDKTPGDYFNLAINESEAEIIRRIYHMYIYDGCGAYKIAKTLNAEGLRTKRSCNWSQNAVSRILKNQLYTGKVINGKEEIQDFLTGVRTKKEAEEWYIVDKPQLRIIDDETYEKAQKILEKHITDIHVSKTRQSNKYIFSTLIKCKHCGYSFRHFKRTYKNTYVTWSCSSRNTAGADSCPNATVISEAELLDEIKAYFKTLTSDKERIIKNVATAFNKTYKSQNENTKTEKYLIEEIKKLKHRKQKYMDMFTNDVITMPELQESTAAIGQAIEKLTARLKLVQYNLSQTDLLRDSITQTFDCMEKILNESDITNGILKSVIDWIEVDEAGNTDIYLKLIKDLRLDETFTFYDNCT